MGLSTEYLHTTLKIMTSAATVDDAVYLHDALPSEDQRVMKEIQERTTIIACKHGHGNGPCMSFPLQPTYKQGVGMSLRDYVTHVNTQHRKVKTLANIPPLVVKCQKCDTQASVFDSPPHRCTPAHKPPPGTPPTTPRGTPGRTGNNAPTVVSSHNGMPLDQIEAAAGWLERSEVELAHIFTSPSQRKRADVMLKANPRRSSS
jgi:hypothetical protein